MRHFLWPTLFCALLFFFGCQENSTSASSTSEAPAPQADTSAAVEAVRDQPVTFKGRIEELCDTLFTDYKQQEMDPVDKFPRFNRSNQNVFRLYRRSQPIKSKVNPRVYPRLTLKAYRFGDEKSVDATVEEYLNGQESSADQIELGDNIEALKSPPQFCAILGSQFILLQTSCIYEHPTYDEMRERFFGWVESQADVRYAWEVTCEAGRTEYRVGGK